MKTKTVLAATAMLSTTHAWGNFAVVNHCTFPIYLWSVAGGEAPGPMVTLPANRPDIGYKETYRTTANGGGVSLKASPNYGPQNSVPMDKVTQLEYTVPSQTDPSQASVKNLIFYDLSWVNGNVFEGISLTMQTSTGDGPNPCPHGSCGLNGESCDIGYEWSTDDTKTHACGLDQDVIWTFCGEPGGSLQSPMGLIGKREAEPEAIPEPAPKAAADSEGLAVCVSLGANGIEEECDSSPASPAPAASSSAAPPPVVALQKPAVPASSSSTTPTPSPTPSPTTTPAAAVATAPAPISNPSGGVVGIQALTNLQMSGVTTWLTFTGANFKRDLTEHSAHRHNHQQFHRRNRIIRSSARA